MTFKGGVILNRWQECSKKMKDKMKELNIDTSYLIKKYNIDALDIEAMLSGEVPYDDKMNELASDFLGISIDCSANLSNYKLAFRKNKDCSRDDTILKNELEVLFTNCIKSDSVIEKVNTSFIKSFSDFKEYFDASRPINIDKFISKNKNKDNFVVIKSNKIKEISGASARLNDRSFIYINTSMPLGRQIFTFFHELYHIYFELGDNDIEVTKSEDISYDCENEADKFSSEILIDRAEMLGAFLEDNRSWIKNINFNDVCDLAEKYNCTFQCIMYCIQNLNKWIKENDLDCQLVKYVPKIPASMMKYYNERYWDELEEKIQDHNSNIKLNTATNEEEIIKSYLE